MVELHSSTLNAHTFENKLWSELLKTHLGLGFVYLSILEHRYKILYMTTAFKKC